MMAKRERCISPWIGFFIIVGVCVVIAGGIFFEFKGTRRHGKTHPKQKPTSAAVQVDFLKSPAEGGPTVEKFIF